MFIEELKNIKSGKKELREFGLIMAAAPSLLNLLLFWRKGEISVFIIFFSIIFFSLSLIGLAILKPLHKIWMTFSLIMGKATTCLILVVLFYLIITPIGLVVKSLNKGMLDLKFNLAKNSYWLDKKQTQESSYEKQF